MTEKEEWRALMREAFGSLKDEEVADGIGRSQPWVNQIRNGRKPSPDILRELLDYLEPPRELRARIFKAAGHFDASIEEQASDLTYELIEEEIQIRHADGRGNPNDCESLLNIIRQIRDEQRFKGPDG